MKKTKKGQAALEFLTTYGWAFLVVLVMIGALAYFGVLDPSRLLPDKCVFGAGIGCQDFVARDTNNDVRVQLINGFGYSIVLQAAGSIGISCTGITPSGGVQCSDPGSNYNMGTFPITWRADEMKEIVITTTGLIMSDRPRIEISFKYQKGGSTYDKNVSGILQVRPI